MAEQKRTHTLYILAGHGHGPVFIGATSDLALRLRQHRSGKSSQSQFRIDRLVYTEDYSCGLQAATRAKALKQASHEWLDSLISSRNPSWQDLSPMPIEKAQAA